MKYGDTLRQRSIPEWGHFNIDYDFLKELIKHNTTPGEGIAVSIPGQGNPTARQFQFTFFKVLEAQHDRINLFIKSKTGEIERRLDYINKRVSQLQNHQQITKGPGAALPAKTVEKYAKIDADVLKAGEEIRCLARFQAAQRTGFYKILKKYKRWTKDGELEPRFKAEVTQSPDSFFQLHLGYLLDRYIDVLNDVRAPFDLTTSWSDARNPRSSEQARLPLQFAKIVEDGSTVDLDLALSTTPIGKRGSKATYWVHSDHILEVEVLLLQYMRLHRPNRGKVSPKASPYATPSRRTSSTSVATSDNRENGDDSGFLVLDHPDLLSEKQSLSTVGDREAAYGRVSLASGYAWWSSSVDTSSVVVGLGTQNDERRPDGRRSALIKRKALPAFLDPTASPTDQLGEVTHQCTQSEAATDSVSAVREWLARHGEAKPIVGVCFQRSRFLGLQNAPTGGVWAVLDRNIAIKSALLRDLKFPDWASKARNDASPFPHALLAVRQEGQQAIDLIDILDRSHLLKRVPGFSLEVHALWTCYRPEAMSAPYWIQYLNQDIRKLPEPVKRQRRKVTVSRQGSTSDTAMSHGTASTASLTDGHTSPSTLRTVDTHAASGAERLPVLTLKNFQKKPKVRPSLVRQDSEEAPIQQRYWNEYDNPEDEDEGYYIYVDPDSEVKFPGQELMEKLAHKTLSLFRPSRNPGEPGLLSIAEIPSSDEYETADESGLGSPRAARNYGTIERPSSPPQPRDSFFHNIIHHLWYSHRDELEAMRRESEHQRRSLVSAIEARQHEREMTKLKFYVTCIAAAVAIDIILASLTMTSRRKERGVVDAVILFGAISNLVLLATALVSMKTRRERLGWVHQGTVLMCVLGVIVVDVLLMWWVWVP